MKRSPFNLSHYKLLTMNMGQLIPISAVEVIPMDSFMWQSQVMLRCQQLLAPLMHPVLTRIHHWYVPFRLIYEDFEDFITKGKDGTTTPTWPMMSKATITQGQLFDYFGIPPGTYSPNLEFSAAYVRAYNLIWNEFYMDKDIQTERTIDLTSGTDSTSSIDVAYVNWERDYYTTCRATQQRGNEVTIPIAQDAPVTGIGAQNTTFAGAVNSYETDGSGTTAYAGHKYTSNTADSNNNLYIEEDPNNSGYPNIRADLTSATGIDISDLRLSLAQQRFQERMQNSPDYYDYLKMLGIGELDGRLQKPEYLAGGKAPIQFSEVLSTDSTNTGQMYGHGIAAMRTNRFKKFFPENGIVMSLMSIVPKAIYSNGLHRQFSRSVQEDFFQKEYEHTGDQAVLNKEVFTEHATPGGTFGYQRRYDEYRTHPSTIAGEFQDSSLDHYHLARMFGSDPSLNSTFISCNPATRPFAAPSTDQFYVYANHNVRARRPLKRNPKPMTF